MSTALSYSAGLPEPPLLEITIGELLRRTAAEHPAQTALIAGVHDPALRREWSYAELLAEAESLGQALLNHFEPGEHIAVWAPNIPEWIALEFAAAMAGLVLVTVNPSYQAAELKYVLNQSDSVALFMVGECRGNPMHEHWLSIQAECPAVRQCVLLTELGTFKANPQPRPWPTVTASDPCMIQYTSGTTGFPKGALLHHRGMVNNANTVANEFGIEECAVCMSTMPLFHTGGCVLAVLGQVSRAATQVLVETFDPGLVLELIETYGASTLTGVPTMLIALLEHPEINQRDLSSIMSVSSGGSTVPAALVERFERELGAPFCIVFGQTECSPVACLTRPSDSTSDKGDSLGRCMPHVENKIIDPITGETQPYGELGEFCTRGYHVMLGYYNMPEQTAATIDADGWLHTGDLCSMDERGYFKIEGRLKDMIIRGGENIYPREIEDLLFKHPDVAEVAVVGVPDERMGEEIAAFVRLNEGANSGQETLFSYLRERLSPQKTPKVWCSIDTFPLTGSGKIQKFRLRELWLRGEVRSL